jgi:heptosyltransferase-2
MVRLTIGAADKNAHVALEAHTPHRAKMGRWISENRKRKNSKLIAIAPAAAYGPAKEWPAEHYGKLIDLLAERDGAEAILVGAPAERAQCVEVAAASRVGAMVAAGETTVGELIALLSLCDGFIGNDSGCAHLAGALGIPTVAIFGSTNPDRTAPIGNRARVIYHKLECSPCLARTCRFGHYHCLTQIEPTELVDKMRELSNRTGLAGRT